MAYEFFDDVAFFFVVCSMIGVLLGPWTLYKLYSLMEKTESDHDPG
jgi:hypothetical protein